MNLIAFPEKNYERHLDTQIAYEEFLKRTGLQKWQVVSFRKNMRFMMNYLYVELWGNKELMLSLCKNYQIGDIKINFVRHFRKKKKDRVSFYIERNQFNVDWRKKRILDEL